MKNKRHFVCQMICLILSVVMICSSVSCTIADQQIESDTDPDTQAQDTLPLSTDSETLTQEVDTLSPDTEPEDNGDQNAMLVPHDAFKNPDNEYRALRIAHEYMNLPGDMLDDKVAKLSEYGFGGVITNDVWNKRYLQNAGQLSLLNTFVQSAHNSGLRVWIYDEYGYPSGSAGDLTCAGHPEYEAVRLQQITVTGNGAGVQMVSLPDAFVKVEYACVETADGYTPIEVVVDGGKMAVQGTNGAWKAYVYCVTKYNGHFEWNSSYPNILNREAIARFIEVTFDTYEGAIENFSEIVEAIFDDEAQLLAAHHITNDKMTNPVIPYDYDIFETFAAKYGYDPKPILPLLYNGTSDEAKRVRAQFYAHVGDLVSENYFGQIQEWCEAHGIKLSGHLLLEEQMFYHAPVYGNYIQCSQNMGYPGFDILDPRPANYIRDMSTGGKYASSPAWLGGQKRVFVEICPVVGGEEFATNHLDYALGTMTFAYFDGGNQLATYYTQANSDPETGRAFNEYVGRLGSMTVGAQNTTEIAIYYTIDTISGEYITPENQNLYSVGEAARENDAMVGALATALREKGLDYVFLDSASMQSGSVNNGTLKVGNFSLKTIIVPKATVMRIEDIRILASLIEQGANIIFVGEMPSIAFDSKDQTELDTFSAQYENLLYRLAERAVARVTTKVDLTVNANQIVYVSPYERDGVEFFFLANASAEDATLTLNYDGAVGYRLYNPVNGDITEISADESCNLASYRALFVQPLMAE